MKTVDVFAKLACGHTVTILDLYPAKANRTERLLAMSAFCDRCQHFQPAVHTWQQPHLYLAEET
jgi:hypothetical protein